VVIDFRKVASAERSANVIGAKAAILKEARLLCTLGHRLGQLIAELASAYARGHLAPIELRLRQGRFDDLVRSSLLTKLPPYSNRAVAPSTVVGHVVHGKALIRNELLVRELVDDALDRFLRMPFALQLALQILGRMLSSRKESNGGDFRRLVIAARLRL
jgi:hypothetical protein